jgi:hypothetical protein
MSSAARSPRLAPRPPPSPTRADRLRDLARRVERLGVAGRTDPESVTINKLTVASELRTLARDLER